MPTARISDKEREAILRLLAKGWEVKDIAREVGVTPRQVAAVKAHITMRSYDKASSADLPGQRSMVDSLNQSTAVTEKDTYDTSTVLDRLQADLSPVAVPVGREITTGKQVYWDPEPDYGSANPHLMIMGESGFGKTYTIQCLVAELAQRGIPSVIIDYGRGFDLHSAPKEFIQFARPVEILAGEHGININPLQIHPSDINGPLNVAVRVSDSFSRVYRIGVQQHAVLRDVILEVFEDHDISKADKTTWRQPMPYLSDVYDKLEMIAANRLHGESKITLSLKSHISTFFIFNTFRSSGEGLNWDAIAADKNRSYIIQLRGLEGRTQQVVTEFLLWDLYHYMVRVGPSPLRLYCVLDEAHNLSFEKETPIDKIIREARKFGVGLIFASQQPEDFTDTAFSNTASKLVFQTLDVNRHVASKLTHKSRNIFDTKSVAIEIGKLSRGRAFLMTQNLGFVVDISNISERSGLW